MIAPPKEKLQFLLAELHVLTLLDEHHVDTPSALTGAQEAERARHLRTVQVPEIVERLMRTKVFQSIDAADRARLPDLLASWSVQRCEWLVTAPEKNQAELLLAELLVLLVLDGYHMNPPAAPTAAQADERARRLQAVQAASMLNRAGEENLESYEEDWNMKKAAVTQMLLLCYHVPPSIFASTRMMLQTSVPPCFARSGL
ncbi:g5580 [Coccomyxa viridis]|uniref:G5580 protein n=1 Tax=Coccomyxa viridis TaxID=1274662 RepID=A0ABP1FT77_9CHLO